MSMFTHVMVGTNNPDQAQAFYDAVFGALGIPGMQSFGSCRLCLVEIDGAKGTPASCTTPVMSIS